jgi:hypothetical protein
VRLVIRIHSRSGDPARVHEDHGDRGVKKDITARDIADNNAGDGADHKHPARHGEVDDILGMMVRDADRLEDGDKVVGDDAVSERFSSVMAEASISRRDTRENGRKAHPENCE